MFDSASLDSIPSTPSPVHQCKKALVLKTAANRSETVVAHEASSNLQSSAGMLQPVVLESAILRVASRQYSQRQPFDE